MSDNEKDTAASPEQPTEGKSGQFVLLQHQQRWAGTRGLRAERGGHRRQGVLLDDGTRIRQKAYRFTEMPVSGLLANHQSILEHVREGRVAVYQPDGETELTYDKLVLFIQTELKSEKIKDHGLKEQVQVATAGVPIEPEKTPEVPAEAPESPKEEEKSGEAPKPSTKHTGRRRSGQE
jgi:hypothetical protein